MNKPQGKIKIYKGGNNQFCIDVKLDGDMVWLNRMELSLLFNRDIKTIGKHINNALKDELSGFSVVANFATTAADGKHYKVQHYNLDMVLSAYEYFGYEMNTGVGSPL